MYKKTLMSKDLFTFWYYLHTTDSSIVKLFLEIFKEDIDKLPNRVTSSKVIRKNLSLDNLQRTNLFKNVFLDYFREKVLYH